MRAKRRLVVAVVLGLCGCHDGDGTKDGEAPTGLDDAGDDGDGDDGADDGDGDDGANDGGEELDFDPAPAVLPRLTEVQYRNSVAALVGTKLPAFTVEPDTNPYLFYSIGATTTTLSELGVQMYEEAAEAIAATIFADEVRRQVLVGCTPTAAGDACVADFIESFGRRAFRRPLTDAEATRWIGVATELADGDPWRGLELTVAGMLQSPNFLYRVELGEPDPEDPTRRRYTGWEMASRLSFLLWNTTPDDALLDAAESGELDDADGIAEHAERLLDDPRARSAVQEFFAQYLDLGRLDGLSRDPDSYPLFSSSLSEAMRNEVKLLVDDFVFGRDEDIRHVFSTQRTFVNDELATLYGLPTPPGATAISYVPVDLPQDGPRAGLLTLGAFLAMNAHETANSPTLRGKYVRERVLCMEVPPPPADVDTTIPADPGEGTTLRERLEAHRSNPECNACHGFIDPPGFLFEHFDPIGAWRDLDNGAPIDSSGELDGVALADASELAALLGDDPRVGQCIVTQLFRHANGRLEDPGEKVALVDIDARFAERGHRFRALLLQLVTHEAFRTLGVES